MRNLKKILALVLALMMVLSVMVTASAVTFEDAESIYYSEAVDVMSALGVLNGYEAADGTYTFKPEGTLTRAEAAKIITYVLCGGDLEAVATDALNNPFEDVSGWAEPYIAYIASEGIVDGNGGGKFFPKNTLTGYEFAKMLLNVLGIEGEYTGKEWKLNVAVNAAASDLLVGMAKDYSLKTNITREEAAQMAFNALYYGEKVEKVVTMYVVLPTSSTYAAVSTDIIAEEYESFALALAAALEVDTDDQQADVQPGAYMTDFIINTVTKSVEITEDTLAEENFGMSNTTVYAQVTDIQPDTTSTSRTYGKLIATAGGCSWVVSDYSLLGHYVNLYVTARGVVKAAIDYSVAVDVYGMTQAEWKAAFPYASFVVNATTNNMGNVTAYVNGQANGTIAANTPNANAAFVAANELVFAYNNAGKLQPVAAIVNNYTADYVNVTKNLDGTIKATLATGNVEIYNAAINPATGKITTDVDYSNIDWASYYNVNPALSKGMFNVQLIDGRYYFSEVETVKGTISLIGPSNAFVTMGEDTYFGFNSNATTNNTGLSVATGFTGNYTLYLDVYGDYFACVAENPTAVKSDVVYVAYVFDKDEPATYGGTTTYTYAQCVAMDGTISNVLIGVNAGPQYSITAGVNTLNAGYYTFATDVTSGSYSALLGFKKATDATAAAGTAINNQTVFQGYVTVASNAFTTSASTIAGNKVTGTNSEAVRLTDDTVYLFINGSTGDLLKTQVVTGGINTTTTAAAYVSKDADGNYIADVVIVVGGLYTNNAVEANQMIYVAANTVYSYTVPYVDAQGQTQTAYVYKVYDAATGELKEIKADADTLSAGFHTFKLNGDIYTVTAQAESTGVATGVTYSSKYGTLLTANQTLADADYSKAIVVDLRTAAQKVASGVSTITSVEDMAYWKTQQKTVTFTALYSTNPVTSAQSISIIFVTGPQS